MIEEAVYGGFFIKNSAQDSSRTFSDGVGIGFALAFG